MNKKIKKAYLAECRAKHIRKYPFHRWFNRLGIVRYKAFWDDQQHEFTGYVLCIRWWYPATWLLIIMLFLYLLFIALKDTVTSIANSVIELKEVYEVLKSNAKSKGIWLN